MSLRGKYENPYIAKEMEQGAILLSEYRESFEDGERRL